MPDAIDTAIGADASSDVDLRPLGPEDSARSTKEINALYGTVDDARQRRRGPRAADRVVPRYGHQSEPDLAEMGERYGGMPVPE